MCATSHSCLPYTLNVAGALTNPNYTVTATHSGTWVVDLASLTITAQGQSKTYGQNLNLGTSACDVSGLLNADSVSSATLSSAGSVATASVTGGPYGIIPSSAVGSGLANYTIKYLVGALTVDPAPIVSLKGVVFHWPSQISVHAAPVTSLVRRRRYTATGRVDPICDHGCDGVALRYRVHA